MENCWRVAEQTWGSSGQSPSAEHQEEKRRQGDGWQWANGQESKHLRSEGESEHHIPPPKPQQPSLSQNGHDVGANRYLQISISGLMPINQPEEEPSCRE
jgi:hypothetical protein